MAWNDSPTAGQLGALTREIESFLCDELDYAKKQNDIEAQHGLLWALDEGVAAEAVFGYAKPRNRMAISKAIQDLQNNNLMPLEIEEYLDGILQERGIKIDYERIRCDRLKERMQSMAN